MKKILVVLTILITVILGSIYAYLKLKVKNYNQEITLPKLNSKSEIVFDEYSIPHIYASNNKDAFRLLGYVQASDRLFQMELLRRVGSGQLSEILGDDLIPVDKYIRTVGLNENAIRAAKAFEKDTNEIFKENVRAYLEGVNQFIENGVTPIEFEIIGIKKEKFEVVDIYRILGYMGFGFSMELQNEPLYSWVKNNLGSSYLKDLSIEVSDSDVKIPTSNSYIDTIDNTAISQNVQSVLEKLPVPIFYGSNSWVISGNKTKSGKVLFANDTHIGFSQPSVWYEAHIETPELNLYGNFLPGIPFPLVGHNLHHSWGLTIFPADALDLFNETIKEDSVLYKNSWTPIETRIETLLVKGKEPQIFTVSSTPHGPIISNLDKFNDQVNQPVSMWWVANNVTDQKLLAVSILSTSKEFNSLEKASKLIDSPGLNVMYGDVEGNIGWIGAAKIVKRPSHVNSKIILHGATGTDDPLGFYPFELNPKIINPKSDFVYSANNQPDSVNGTFYPGYYYKGARASTIFNKISEKDDWDMAAMQELVMNNTSPIYPDNIKVITQNIQPTSKTETIAMETLQSWTGEHKLTDIAPTIYYKLIYHLLYQTMADELSEKRFNNYLKNPTYLRTIPTLIRNDSSVWWNNILTPETESRHSIFQKAFEVTIIELTDQFGSNVNNWTWEKVHLVESPHPLGKKKPLDILFNVGPIASPGGEEVINKIAFSLNDKGIYKARSGPAMRILLDFNDIENSISINPSGQSGYFMNPHYDDQAQMYANGTFRKQKMNKQDIQKDNIGIWSFTP